MAQKKTTQKLPLPSLDYVSPVHGRAIINEPGAVDRYDRIVEKEVARLGLSLHWGQDSRELAKKMLASDELDIIHTVSQIKRIRSKADESETFCLELTFNFWPSGYFERDRERYIRVLRVLPPELDQISGLRSWLSARWTELYPHWPPPDVLRNSAPFVGTFRGDADEVAERVARLHESQRKMGAAAQPDAQGGAPVQREGETAAPTVELDCEKG